LEGAAVGSVDSQSLDHRSIPQRITDRLAASILNGEFRDGDHLTEESVAERFAVSRSPVREAFQKLARRGLLQILPRRGAFVIGASLELVADQFNVRGVLIALVGRYFARHHTPALMEEADRRIAEVVSYCRKSDADPLTVAQKAAWSFEPLIQHCRAPSLVQMLDDHQYTSSWGVIWQGNALDFQTAARRRGYGQDMTLVASLIRDRRDRDVESLLRQMMFESRDAVLRSLIKLRGGAVDSTFCFDDGERGNEQPKRVRGRSEMLP
jgi:DNA-binding GntR family transcriptional regulator